MYALVRSGLFLLSAPAAHALGMAALAPVEYLAPVRALTRACLAKDLPELRVRTMGLDFPSPIGLAGGFDKDARRPRALAALGFGHLELGTVTARPQEANPEPNLFRLPADRALVNRLGFPNEGASRVVARLLARGGAKACGVPVGLSIGKSRAVPIDPIDGAVEDYLASFREVVRAADYVVVNVSSPNTKDLRVLQGAETARTLLSALRRENDRIPLLVKVAPDLDDAGLDALLGVVSELGLEGVVATNTTVGRAGLETSAAEIERIGAGGLSGPPLRARALEVVRRARRKLGPKATVIGVGGVERGLDVLAYARAGANLVQMYTGFVYGGPMTPRHIARELAELVAREGAASIAELVAAPGAGGLG